MSAYERYREEGGILSEHVFELAHNALSGEHGQKTFQPIETQAREMAKKSGMELSSDLVRVYGALRGWAQKDSPREEWATKNEGRLSRMSDQEIFNETLLLTGQFEMAGKFRAKYPNIFKE